MAFNDFHNSFNEPEPKGKTTPVAAEVISTPRRRHGRLQSRLSMSPSVRASGKGKGKTRDDGELSDDDLNVGIDWRAGEPAASPHHETGAVVEDSGGGGHSPKDIIAEVRVCGGTSVARLYPR
jgi:hypothetical protein